MSEYNAIHIDEDLQLKQICAAQAEPVYNAIETNRKFLRVWLPFVDSIKNIVDIENYIASLNTKPEAFEPVFCIYHQNNFAGLVGFKNTNLNNNTTEIGYWLMETMQKKGIVTRSIRFLIDDWFKRSPLTKIEIKCAIGNLQSKNIPLALGFKWSHTEEKGELLASGNFTDLDVYVIEKKYRFYPAFLANIKKKEITRIELSEIGNSPFEKLIGHNKEILNKWIELENAIFQSSTLNPHLLEQVRRTLSFGNECEYCMVKGGKPEFNKNDKKAQSATAFAELFAIDHKSINDDHFSILKEDFTDKEISELCSFISFISACQKLGRIYNLTEDLQENKITTIKELNNVC